MYNWPSVFAEPLEAPPLFSGSIALFPSIESFSESIKKLTDKESAFLVMGPVIKQKGKQAAIKKAELGGESEFGTSETKSSDKSGKQKHFQRYDGSLAELEVQVSVKELLKF